MHTVFLYASYSFPQPFSIFDACVTLGIQISSGELGWVWILLEWLIFKVTCLAD
jgi:hypothetical protein